MSVSEVMDKFNRLTRLCPDMVKTEEERVQRMMEMFRLELALNIDSGSSPPSTVADCLSRAIRAEYRLSQLKEERALAFKARKKEKSKIEDKRSQRGGNCNFSHHHLHVRNPNRFHNNNNKMRGPDNRNQVLDHRRVQSRSGNYTNNQAIPCKKYGRNYFGECKMGITGCYSCDQ